MPALPFPQKQRIEKLDKQFGHFLELLKQVHDNLPFTEVLSQMPTYAKFMKDIWSNKWKAEEISAEVLNLKCLSDSGASINLMPLSIFRELEGKIGEIRSIPVSFQLADQTTIIPEGIMEDVLVQVDKFVFPMELIMVNIKENKEVPMILGRLFLATGRTILDIQERQLMLRVGEERVVFKMKEAIGAPRDKLMAFSDFKILNGLGPILAR
ncbi:PREDICTED: uncharacterized protein LOC109242835 [Nicotiana attenuata]|uniref:uncharacterized protein LOC109242835 n=1 Tax=Nicotiana attenuata TaxID=49451 RepID=UPI00090573E4|nr:PREDICTED: uncharacterized protein LOC109242835 [Nicotiana attenuata]